MMDFFKELRDAAYKIERGVTEVKDLAEASRCTDDLAAKGALVLLRDKRKDVYHMKTEASHLLRTVRGDVPFDQFLRGCEQLMEKNFQILEKTQAHLEKYGYKRLEQKVDDKKEPEPAVVREVSSVSCEEEDKSDDEQERPSTPECSYKPSEDLNRTPKLADFGLSEATMKIISEKGTFKNSSNLPPVKSQLSDFKVPGPPVLSARGQRHSPVRSKPWSGDNDIPDVFKHDGVLVTPGLMSGLGSGAKSIFTPASDRQHAQYGTSPAMRPSDPSFLASSPPQSSTHLGNKLFIDEPSSPDHADSPIPPVFCTPGVKQIVKQPFHATVSNLSAVANSDDHTPEPPQLMTPRFKSMQKEISESDLKKEVDGVTPEVPVLVTPGFREKVSGRENMEFAAVPKITVGQDMTDTPEAPELTCSYRFLMTETAPTVSTIEVNNQVGEKIMPKSPDSILLSSRPILQNFDNICDTPEAPELTMTYKFGPSQPAPALSLRGDTPSPMKPKLTEPEPSTQDQSLLEVVKPPPVLGLRASSNTLPETPQLLVSKPAMDFATPQMPELTGKYNFSAFNAALADEELEDKENAQPKAKNKTNSNKSTESKNNFLSGGPVKPSFPEEVAMCVYVPLVTGEEYTNQPDYMQNILAQDKLNMAIKKLNKILANRIQAESCPQVCDQDLQNDLESNESRVFFLCLMRLGRLSLKQHAHGKKYYTPT